MAASTPSETWHDMVVRVAHDVGLQRPSDNAIEHILWEQTAFPFANHQHVERQVRTFLQERRDAGWTSEHQRV